MKSLPLRYTIALSFIGLVLLTASVVVFLLYRSAQKDIQNLAYRLHSESFSGVYNSLKDLMSIPQEVNKNTLSSINSREIDINNVDEVGAYLFHRFLNNPEIISMEYADENKNEVGPVRNLFGVDLSYGKTSKDNIYRLYESDLQLNLSKILYEEANYDPREKNWYQIAIKTNHPTWTPVYLWPNGDLGLDAVMPIRVDGKLVGVIDSAITINQIGNYLRNTKITPNSNIYIVESDGAIVAGTDIEKAFTTRNGDIERLLINESESENIKQILPALNENNINLGETVENRQIISRNGEKSYITLSSYTDDFGLNWLVIMSTPERDLMTNLYENTQQITYIILLAVFVSILIAFILSGWITSPITQLIQYSQDLARGNWSNGIKNERTDEVGQLTNAFIKMSMELRKNTESLQDYANQLLGQRQQLSAVLGSMGDAVIVADNQKKIILVNNALTKITGLTEKEIEGMTLADFVNKFVAYETDKDKVIDTINLLYNESTGLMYFDVTEMKTKNGGVAIADGVGSRLKTESGMTAGVVLLVRDITERQELEKMKNVFVSLASHQLRTPLTGIKWSIGGIEKMKASVPNKVMKLINDIGISNDKMISLVEALLSISKVNSPESKTGLRKKAVSIKAVLSQSAELSKRLFREKEVKLLGLNEINPKYEVFGDEEQLVQSFMNILQNAAQYSHKGKSVTLDCEEKGGNYIVSISDKGFGIPQEEQEKIFNRFYRASNVADIVPGTGLGLFYVKNVSELHGGKVWFDSEIGKGTTFYVQLPSHKKTGKTDLEV